MDIKEIKEKLAKEKNPEEFLEKLLETTKDKKLKEEIEKLLQEIRDSKKNSTLEEVVIKEKVNLEETEPEVEIPEARIRREPRRNISTEETSRVRSYGVEAKSSYSSTTSRSDVLEDRGFNRPMRELQGMNDYRFEGRDNKYDMDRLYELTGSEGFTGTDRDKKKKRLGDYL